MRWPAPSALPVSLRTSLRPSGRAHRRPASNQVVLNQFTSGERVESPSASQLPVLLAVALLKDRNGVIDINLPVGGSVNDPQFSTGGIVWKIILNLLGKALTAPFSLLAGAGRGWRRRFERGGVLARHGPPE